jgi:hypothetical protein
VLTDLHHAIGFVRRASLCLLLQEKRDLQLRVELKQGCSGAQPFKALRHSNNVFLEGAEINIASHYVPLIVNYVIAS